jgi:hypothetical protein
MLRRSRRRSGLRCGRRRPFKTLADDNSDGGQCGARHSGSHKAAVVTNQKPFVSAKASGKGPERSGMGTKRQSMAKIFTAQVHSRTRSSRKSTRAVEESLLVVLALNTFGLLSGEWRVGKKSAWGRKPGVITVVADSPLKRHFDLIFWRTFTHLHR